MAPKYPGDNFIYPGDPDIYVKRGSQVIRSIQRNLESFGIVGSDKLGEVDFLGQREVIGAVKNTRGQVLRFGLIAKQMRPTSQELPIVTSYPETARRVLGSLGLSIGSLEYVEGCVESEVGERDLVGFELIQSGKSVRENDLVILEDDLERVNLVKISRTNITPTLASQGETCENF